MASDNVYGRQGGDRSGQKGPSYPSLNRSSNPLQDVRDINAMPQEISYKMQPGNFMPNVVNTEYSEKRVQVRDGGYQPGDQNFDLRAKSFASLDKNYREEWIDTSPIGAADGRK